MNDIVVKSLTPTQHSQDLSEVFLALIAYNLKLNLKKCLFGTDGGKFLGFMLTHWGIEVNPEKFQAIIDIRSPKNVERCNDS